MQKKALALFLRLTHRVIFLILMFLTFASSAKAINLFNQEIHGFLDYNAYHDTRTFTVNTINAKLDLPGPLSYFSLTNWDGNHTGDEFFNFETYLTEQNLMYNIAESPFDLTMQYLSLTGEDNDILRFGLQAKVEEFPYLKKFFKKINAWYHFTYFAWQVDHLPAYASQLQHVWFVNIFPKFFDNRLYMLGFADQNLYAGAADSHNKLVCENQFGFRLWKGLYAVTELRWNGFFPKGDRFGLGLGFEYKFTF